MAAAWQARALPCSEVAARPAAPPMGDPGEADEVLWGTGERRQRSAAMAHGVWADLDSAVDDGGS